MKYTCQLYISGGFEQPLDGPLAVGTPYVKNGDHINFLLPSPSGQVWPTTYITGYWENKTAEET